MLHLSENVSSQTRNDVNTDRLGNAKPMPVHVENIDSEGQQPGKAPS